MDVKKYPNGIYENVGKVDSVWTERSSMGRYRDTTYIEDQYGNKVTISVSEHEDDDFPYTPVSERY